MASLTTAEPAAKQRLGEGDFHGIAHHNAQNNEEKVSQQKKTEFLRTAGKLKKQIEKIENERRLIAQPRKNILKDGYEGLEEFENNLRKERQSEMVSLKKQLVKIHHGVKRFQRQLTDIRPTPELIEKLKEIMTEVENSINTFKEDQRFRYEELLKEERTCALEVSALDRKMDAWSMAGKADAHLHLAPPPSAKVGVTRALEAEPPPEVSALETFLLQTGGMQGGWDPYDHQSFLKVWTKHHGRPAYRKEAQLYLPSRTLQGLQQHEDWYLELLHLQHQKKEAIQRWRSARQQSRLARLQVQGEEEGTARMEAQALALRRQAEEERREAALRLEDWRERRKRQQEQEEERRRVEEVQQRRRAQEERRRQQEVKLALEAQLRERREEEEAQALRRAEEEQGEEEERRRTAGQEIRRFQERDLHKMESKLQEKQLKEKQEEERQKRLAKLKEKVVVNVSRDPSRVCKPTRGWEERTKEIGPTGGGPVLQMFHRAVPTWRQGL
ncbi:coiled-coil domain-containing protein 112 [Osmerus eperlanus]|uniref:coiled-coil domain-containing protein 112 n=1 Tax=Osmerus eperlanus TaxID=29151 RepID=UPI002E10D677